ncbi:class-II aminoacyl-tRNA synthetase family protein [Kitasatospora mediocidica]|uniref:aminoacyl-tRNA synthetase n=1 Tax=Kitasatospora mediocidica TaxID=58352 RepID=UPI00056D8EEE|nr:aminoacyl-tRNA synthetase [Kitasatospora mediocidica]
MIDDEALPLPTGVPGVLLYPEAFERIVAGLRAGIGALAVDEPFRRLTVPPVISRQTIEQAGYVATFPQLLGTVHSYAGTAEQWGELAPRIATGGEWHERQRVSDLVLLPAACYPVYATLAGRDLAEPARFAVEAHCFRQEATSEVGRLRTFRMAELVTAGDEEHCLRWRGRWLDRVADWLSGLSLKVTVEVADDPFFGAGRRLYQAAQRMQQLKYELRVPVADGLVQAVASANIHKDHFGSVFGFTSAGATGHTACTAFGIERIALALLHAHGSRPDRWPAEVVQALSARSAGGAA